MASNYPVAIDNIGDAPTVEKLGASTPSHSEHHDTLRDAVVAVQAYVGVVGSADAGSIEHRLKLASDVADSVSEEIGIHVSALAPHTGHATPASVAAATAAAIAAHESALAPHTKAQVGLAAVDNTADAGKPVSGPQAAAIATAKAEAIAACPPETAATVGAITSGATPKAAPADADSVGLADSAAGGLLKKLTWGNVKLSIATYLDAFYARLAGVAGGQTLNGGTGAGDSLTVNSTTHATKGRIMLGSSAAYDESTNRLGVGTTSPAATAHFVSTGTVARLGYDSGSYADMTVSSSGVLTITPTGGSVRFRTVRSSATLGTELVVNGGFATDLVGWTDSGSSWSWVAGTAAHTAGVASTLSQSVTVVSGATYEVGLSITGRTAGTITISVGPDNIVSAGTSIAFSSSAQRTFTAGAPGGVVQLTISPSLGFNGALDSVSLRQVTTGSVTAAIAALDAAGASACEIRAHVAATYNTAVGLGVQRSIVTGTGNTGLGNSAQFALSDGGDNCAFGALAQLALTNGSSNSAFGRSSQFSLINGYDNSAYGMYSQLYLVGGYGNISLGARCAAYLADGVTAAVDFNRCIHIGNDTRVSANGAINEIAVGHAAIGLGSNTCVIGNSSITKTKLFGSPILVPAASAVPAANGELAIEATSDTSLTFRLRGSDGIVRSASLTLT